MKIVLTGSNGFIGKNLLTELLRKYPEAEIKCLVRFDKKSTHERVENVTVNYLSRESIINSKVIENADYIFHVAGVTKSATKKGFWEGNVIPTENLLKAVKHEGVKLKRFVLISSHAGSGPSHSRDYYRVEHEKEEPAEMYGLSKFEAEKITKAFGNEIPYTIICPGGVYGPGDVDFFNIFKMTKTGINVYAGVKHKFISLIFSEDLVNAIIQSAFSENCINKKYFIVDDHPVTWKEIHETIFSIAGKKRLDISLPFSLLNILSYLGSAYSILLNKPVLFNKNKMGMSAPNFWIASNESAKKDFGFTVKYSLRESLTKTYDWYKKNNWI